MTFRCWERNVCAEQNLAPCSLLRFRLSSLFNHYFIVLPLFLPRSWHVQNSWKYFSYVLLVVDVTNIVPQNGLLSASKNVIIAAAIIIIIIIIIIKKIFTNNEWWADPGLSLTKVLWLWTNFQMQMAQTTVY